MTQLAQWKPEQIASLAPDDQVAKAGRGLARPAKWQTLGTNDSAVWGEIKGSGKDPYRVAVDLTGPAFKCSCPSGKKPCKHAIGLFFAAQANSGALTAGEPPDWVAEWLAKRQATAERKAQKAAEPSAVDAAAQAKRAARREDLVQQGIDALTLWLADLVRQGLSDLPARPRSYWETQAARLVDAQAPGLARHVREMSAIPYSGEGWPARLLDRLGRLHLLLEAYARLDTLPTDMQEEVRTQVGWPQDQGALLAQPGVRDRWLVLSVQETTEDKLRVQSTWLWGTTTHQAALLLDFAAPMQNFTLNLPYGMALDAELVFFTAPAPHRALLKTRAGVEPVAALSGYPTLAAAIAATSATLTRSPWIERFLWPLDAVIPTQHAGQWYIQDVEGRSMPLNLSPLESWRLLALSGGHPLTLVAEWDREKLTPLSAWTGQTLAPLN